MVVVGGGILGLTLADRLAESGHHVTVLEGATRVGGLAAPQSLGDFTWDRFYHVILESDSHLLGLLEVLGLRDRVRWGTTRTGFFTDGRFHSMSTSLEFLRFPPLGLVDKARLALTILRASRIRDGAELEKETVEAWLRRWSGARTFEKIWQPLLEAKLGVNWRKASAAFIWAIIARMYAARRSGLKNMTSPPNSPNSTSRWLHPCRSQVTRCCAINNIALPCIPAKAGAHRNSTTPNTCFGWAVIWAEFMRWPPHVPSYIVPQLTCKAMSWHPCNFY